jgi:hypothetical protein
LDKKVHKKILRMKFYGKSEDKITSTGVKETGPKDPYWKLLLTGSRSDRKSDNLSEYYRTLIHSNGIVISRIEFSFYGK